MSLQNADSYRSRTGHFILFWSVPTEIYQRKAFGDSELAVLEFGPRGTRESWRYVTNGMSEHPQNCAAAVVRTELFAATANRQEWGVALLDALARYPQQRDTWFAEFDTVAVGRPIDRADSPFTAILIAPPSSEESGSIGAISNVMNEPILVHQVLGIYQSECDFAAEHGGKELYERLRGVDAPTLLDVSRDRVV